MQATQEECNGGHKRALNGTAEGGKRQKTAWQSLPLGDEVLQLPCMHRDGREHEVLKAVLAASGLRASAVMVPRRAVSVYTRYSDEDKQIMRTLPEHAQLVQVALGLHPDQVELENRSEENTS